MKSVSEQDVYKVMRSSGTSGYFSRIFLDRNTARKQTLALSQCFADHFWPGRFPMLVIDSEKTIADRTSFSVRTAGINGFSMFSRGRCFALDDDLILDFDAINDFLATNSGKMIFIFGFTSVIWDNFLKTLETTGQTPTWKMPSCFTGADGKSWKRSAFRSTGSRRASGT